MSIYKDGKLIAGGRQCMPLLSFMWADHQLNDASWLRADTFSWQSGAVYQAAYQHLADDMPAEVPTITLEDSDVYIRYAEGDVAGANHPYCWIIGNYTAYTNSETPSIGDWTFATATSYLENARIIATGTDMPSPETETIAGITISYYEAADGHKLVLPDQESNVTAIYNATGVAWYYILDTVNQRFKLPRTKFGFTGIRSGVGNYVSPGIPNITGKFSPWGYQNQLEPSGVFYQTGTGTHAYSAGDAWVGSQINFDASRSSSVYGASDTVQSPATEMYLYFYVGNFTQTALENTAGVTTEALNNKVDKGFDIVEFQEPTAANGYTWYKKYRNGWVEQGGIKKGIANNSNVNVSLPITMSDTNYTVTIAQLADTSYFYTNQGGLPYDGKHTTYIVLTNRRFLGNESRGIDIDWQVSGMAA